MADTKTVAGGGKKSGKPRLNFIWLVVGVIALAGLFGVGFSWLTQQLKNSQTTIPEVPLTKAQEAQTVALDGDYDKAHKTLEDALKNPQISDSEKYDLTFQQGITYENQEKFDQAIEKYKQAEVLKATFAVAEAIARAAEAKDDKSLALEYYKKALERIPADEPNAEGYKEIYNYKIKELGGGQ
jgi:tetratricopeptide (TPR) repeat protein